MFFPLTQHLPDPYYLPIYLIYVLSQRREGREEGKENKLMKNKIIRHWHIHPTLGQAPRSGVAG